MNISISKIPSAEFIMCSSTGHESDVDWSFDQRIWMQLVFKKVTKWFFWGDSVPVLKDICLKIRNADFTLRMKESPFLVLANQY